MRENSEKLSVRLLVWKKERERGREGGREGEMCVWWTFERKSTQWQIASVKKLPTPVVVAETQKHIFSLALSLPLLLDSRSFEKKFFSQNHQI